MKTQVPLETRILVLDPNETFCDSLRKSFLGLNVTPSDLYPVPICGSTLRECQRYLSDRDFAYKAVFINPRIGHPSWIACVKSTHQYRPGIPCFIVFDEIPRLPAAQMAQLGVQGFIKTPVQYLGLVDFIFGRSVAPLLPDGAAHSRLSAPKAAKQDDTKTSVRPKTILEKDLVKVESREVIASPYALFEIYSRTPDQGFFCLAKVGDALVGETLEKCRVAGVGGLFIPKIQQRKYLDFCDGVLSQYLQDPKTTVENKVKEISQFGAENLDFLKTAGFEAPNIERAEKFIHRVTEGLTQVAANSPAVKVWIENATMLEHSVGVSTVAGLLLKHIGVIKPETYQAVGVAAFLHDIGLLGMPPECLEEDESKMNEEQKALFYQHPLIGAKKLASDPHPPSLGVIKAIEQHHMRLKGGFPLLRAGEELSPIAEIIGLAGEFCHILRVAQQDKSINPIEKIKESSAGRFSPAIIHGLMATLSER